MESDVEAMIREVRAELQRRMESEHACAEYLSAMGHVDAALRDLRIRDARIQDEQERSRIEAEAQANGAYDTFDQDPRDEDPSVGSADS